MFISGFILTANPVQDLFVAVAKKTWNNREHLTKNF